MVFVFWISRIFFQLFFSLPFFQFSKKYRDIQNIYRHFDIPTTFRYSNDISIFQRVSIKYRYINTTISYKWCQREWKIASLTSAGGWVGILWMVCAANTSFFVFFFAVTKSTFLIFWFYNFPFTVLISGERIKENCISIISIISHINIIDIWNYRDSRFKDSWYWYIDNFWYFSIPPSV